MPRLLPVWHEGQLRLVRWGTRRDESQILPPTGWTWQASVESGGWGAAELHPVVIPATLAIENGIWVVRADVAGQNGTLTSYGSSEIVDPQSKVVQSAHPFTVEMLVSEMIRNGRQPVSGVNYFSRSR